MIKTATTIPRRPDPIPLRRPLEEPRRPNFAAPSVVVAYTDKVEEHNGSAFKALGVQIAAGVPLKCDEAPSFQTFRIGLFGLDKLLDVDRTIARFESAIKQLPQD